MIDNENDLTPLCQVAEKPDTNTEATGMELGPSTLASLNTRGLRAPYLS